MNIEFSKSYYILILSAQLNIKKLSSMKSFLDVSMRALYDPLYYVLSIKIT